MRLSCVGASNNSLAKAFTAHLNPTAISPEIVMSNYNYIISGHMAGLWHM